MSIRRLEPAIRAGRELDIDGDTKSEMFEGLKQIATQKFGDEKDGIYTLQFSPDRLNLVAGFGDGSISILDAKTGEVEKEVRMHRYGALAITCLRFHPKQSHVFLASSSEGNIYSCNLLDGACLESVTEIGNEINCLDYRHDGSIYATAGKDLTVRVYDSSTNQLVKSYSGYSQVSPTTDVGLGHAQRVFALRFDPAREHIFVTGGWDNHLKVWDLRTADGVKRLIGGPHVCGDGIDIQGTNVLTASWTAKDALQVWAMFEGDLIQTIPFPDRGDGQYLYCTRFCDNYTVLAGGSGTKSIQAIDTLKETVIGELLFEKPVQALDCTNGGRLFAAGSGNGVLKIAKLF